jgi:hypothetical protein
MAKKKANFNKPNSSGWLDNYSEEFSISKHPDGGGVWEAIKEEFNTELINPVKNFFFPEEKKKIVYTDPKTLPKSFNLQDNRKINPITKKALNPTRDLKNFKGVSKENVQAIIKMADYLGYPRDLALAVSLQESGLGKTDANLGHNLDYDFTPKMEGEVFTDAEKDAGAFISGLKDKANYTKTLYKQKKIPKDDLIYQLQAYNGFGKLTPNTELNYYQNPNQKFYGVDVKGKPLSLKDNPLYGKTIINYRDSIINQDPILKKFLNLPKYYEEGGEVNSYLQEAETFLNDYYNSPRYKEMVSNSTIGDLEKPANYFTENRLNNLKTKKPLVFMSKDKGNLGGTSNAETGEIKIYPRDYDNMSTYLHELVHSSDRPLNKKDLKENIRVIPNKDIELINKLVFPDLKSKMSPESYNKYSDKEKQEKENYYKKKIKNYIATPEEVRARLIEIRKAGKDNNIFDPFTQEVGYPEYKKLLELEFNRLNSNDKGNYPLLDLFEGFDNDGIIQMLNEISQNQENDSLPMAKNGGEIYNDMKKNIKKYPAGGYLNYQEGYKGFGVGPELYQDNSYFRSVMPDNIENMEEQINQPSVFSGINNILGSVNQGVNKITGLMSNIPQSSKSNPLNLPNPEDSFMQNYQSAPAKKLDLNGELDLTGIEEPDMSKLWGEYFNSGQSSSTPFPSKLLESVSFKNGGKVKKYQNGGDMDMLPVGSPEYIHKSNVFHENYNPVPRVHFSDDTTPYDMGVNLNDLVNMNGGRINKYAGGGFAEMYGNSYGGSSNSPRLFNANTGRATLQDLQSARENDFLHTKMRNDRQGYEDDKVDWGFMDWAKEPVGAYLGMMSTVPIVGDITKDIVGDSFLTRTSGYQVGKGIGKTTSGLQKVIGGVALTAAGSPQGISMIGQGVGDVGSGVGGTIGNLNAKSAMGDYDKQGYVSGKRMEKSSQDFGNMMYTASDLFGNISGGVNQMKGLGGKSGIGGQQGAGGFDFSQLAGMMKNGGYLNNYQEGGMVSMPEDFEIAKFKKGGLTPAKAEKMLQDKSFTTDKQRKYFGYISSQKKTSGGWLDEI